MNELEPPPHQDVASRKEETPRSHNYYGEIQDFQSLPQDIQTEQEQRQTVLAGTAKMSDHDGEEIQNACMLEDRPHTEIAPSKLKKMPNDTVLLQNLRKAMVQSCFNNDLELNTPLSQVPFIRVMKGTYGKSPEYAYDGSLNEKPMVYELARELIELNQYTTLGDFIEEVAAHVCDEEQKFQTHMNSMGEFTHQYEKLKRTKNVSGSNYIRLSEIVNIPQFIEMDLKQNQKCVLLRILNQDTTRYTFNHNQKQQAPFILAGFEMEPHEEVVEDILQPTEGQLETKVEDNPEITFLVQSGPSQEESDQQIQEKNKEEYKERGECSVLLKDILSFIGVQNLKRKSIPPTALKFPIVFKGERKTEIAERSASRLQSSGQSIMGYIHVKFEVRLSKRERLYVIESQQQEILKQMTQIKNCQQKIQAKMNDLLGPFPGVIFNGKEGTLMEKSDNVQHDSYSSLRGSTALRRPHIPQLNIDMIYESEDREMRDGSSTTQKEILQRSSQTKKGMNSKKMLYLNRSYEDEELMNSRRQPKEGRNCGCQRDCNLKLCSIF